MSARRALAYTAAALATVLVAGCTQSASSDAGNGGRSARGWSTNVDWPFSLGVAGREAVVTVSRNRVVDLDAASGRERWHADLAHVTHYDPVLDANTVLIANPAAAMELTSPDIRDGAPIAKEQVYTRCGGQNVSPALSWRGAPAGTKSFAITAIDHNVPPNDWSHWIVIDIPPGTTSLGKGASVPAGSRPQQATALRRKIVIAAPGADPGHRLQMG